MTANGRQNFCAKDVFALVLGLWCALFQSISYGSQHRYNELDLKAAYIFNFMKFVEWPEERSDALPQINVCAYSGDPILAKLKRLESQRIRNLKVVLQVYDSAADINQCQLIYLNVISAEKRAEILQAVKNKPVLTIGHEGRYSDDDEIITFFAKNNRLRFDINYRQAQQGGLQISSRLLRLARVSEQPQDD